MFKKKTILIAVLIALSLSVSFSVKSAHAGWLGKAWHYVETKVRGGAATILKKGASVDTTIANKIAPTATNVKVEQINNVTSQNSAFNVFNAVDADLLKAGPQVAKKLVGASGRLFDYLAVIAIVLWSIQNLLFGDKGIKEFMIFFLFLAFAKGLLAGYGFFFGGTVNMFYALGQQVAGTNNPLTLFQTVIIAFDGKIVAQLAGLTGSILHLPAFLTALVLYSIGALIIDASFFLIAGTILVIQFYIIIAMVTGYILVPFMIVKPLEFLWNGWLKFLISSALAYFMVFAVLKIFSMFMSNVLMTYIDSIIPTANYADPSIANELTYTFILLVFAWLVTKLPGIAAEIVSGMPNMSVSGIISMATGAASMALAAGTAGAGVAAKVAAKTGTEVAKKSGKEGGDKE